MRSFSEFSRSLNENSLDPTEQLLGEFDKLVDDFVADLKRQLINPYSPNAQRGVWDRMKGWWNNVWHGRYNQQNPEFWRNKLGDDLGSHANESVLPLSEYTVLKEQADLLEGKMRQNKYDAPSNPFTRKFDNNLMKRNLFFPKRPSNPFMPIERHRDEYIKGSSTPTRIPKRRQEPKVDPQGPGEEILNIPSDVKEVAGTENLQITKLIDSWAAGFKQAVRDLVSQRISSGVRFPMPSMQRTKREAPAAAQAKPAEPEATAQAPEAAPATPEAEAAPEDSRFRIDPANRHWKMLDALEKDAWDDKGGGTARKVPRKSVVGKEGIDTLPWILRKGDPRIAVLRRLGKGSNFTALVADGRVEGHAVDDRGRIVAAPEITPEELPARIEAAKKNFETRMQSYRRGATADAALPPRVAAELEKVGDAPAPEPEPEPKVAPVTRKKREKKVEPAPEEKAAKLNDRLANLKASGRVDDETADFIRSNIESDQLSDAEELIASFELEDDSSSRDENDWDEIA